MNKKILFGFLALAFMLASSCSTSKNEHHLRIAATAVPHAEILEAAQSDLYLKGISLKIIIVNDFTTPNRMLAEGDIDANYFQHFPFLNEQIKQFNYPLTCLEKVHLEPMGLYSKKIKTLDALNEKDSIAIPNDPSNEGRALLLLQHHGIITLKNPNNLFSTILDIEENPKKLRFIEVDAAMLPRSLSDVDAAIINTNFAMQADLNPLKDAIIIEGTDSPYTNIVAVRVENKNDPRMQILAEVLNSEMIKKFILEKYKGAIIPAFGKCEEEHSRI